jgi:hypothetical protein
VGQGEPSQEKSYPIHLQILNEHVFALKGVSFEKPQIDWGFIVQGG